MSVNWHSLKLDKIFERLHSSENGLSGKESEHRLKEHGKNEIERKDKISPIQIFISQFKDFLIIILLIAALVSFLVGHSMDFYLIITIVMANGIFGFVQDWKAEKSIEALKKMASPEALVLRSGEKKKIDSKDIVPGDIIILEQGSTIPADARILEQHNLRVDESALTGESEGVSKDEGILDKEISLADIENMVYKYTNVVRGRGKAIVVETGMKTEIGQVATQLEKVHKEKTPFQKEVDSLGKKIGGIILAICAIIIPILVFLHGTGIVDAFLTAIALAVAAVPEGLPAVVTLSLALGTRKMLDRNSLVRKLPVVESLGSVDVICTDKTGTLTEGDMVVKKIFYNGNDIDVTGGYSSEGEFKLNDRNIEPSKLELILKTGLLCNDSEINGDDYMGEPTEIALLQSAQKAGLHKKKLERKEKRIDEIPFSSEKKKMTTIHSSENEKIAYKKGAPEVILEDCNRYWKNGEIKELDNEKKKEFLDKNNEFAKDALRVLGFAYKEIDSNKEEIGNDFIFLGLQGMIDPPRKEVKEAINTCRNAGIRSVMITGDNEITAKAIGNELGFEGNVLTGKKLEKMTNKELSERVEEVDIYARVSPSHKVDILNALKENDHIVAMTGDGVNDAPALKRSDVGIAMGIRGTDVSQQASDMVLLDDNYNSIKDAVAEGRGIFDNIRKFVNYLLSANIGEVFLVFVASLVGFVGNGSEAVIPLTAVMLLWINLLTDGLPALALGVDPKSEGVMNRKPRKKEEGVINNRMMFSIFGMGIMMGLIILGLFEYSLPNAQKAQTIAFTSLVVFELVRIQAIRSRYDIPLISNKWLGLAILSSVILQLIVLYTPLNSLFGVIPLGWKSWELIFIGICVFAFFTWILVKIENAIFK
ncbi:MAG: cation-translocating P-type ATPase [Candidatus Aenigmatarchaeota archaeon]